MKSEGEKYAQVLEAANRYYKNNKDRVLERLKEKIPCEYCSKKISRVNVKRHHKYCKMKPQKAKLDIEKEMEDVWKIAKESREQYLQVEERFKKLLNPELY